MQAANAAAPAIVAAVKLLASADQQHVAYAMVGLKSRRLVEAAQAAARQLQPVAERLAVVASCELVAAELREEMIAVRAASSTTYVPAGADWGEFGELLSDLILTALPVSSGLILGNLDDVPSDECGHPQMLASRYAASGVLAKVNRCWTSAMREWRRRQRQVVLVSPDSAAIRMVARDSPAVEELYLYSSGDYILDMDGSGLLALRACGAMRRLCMPNFENLSTTALVEFLTAMQQLVEVDVSGSYLEPATRDALLLNVCTSRPSLYLRVHETDDLWTSSDGKRAREQLRARNLEGESIRELPFGPVYIEDWDPDASNWEDDDES